MKELRNYDTIQGAFASLSQIHSPVVILHMDVRRIVVEGVDVNQYALYDEYRAHVASSFYYLSATKVQNLFDNYVSDAPYSRSPSHPMGQFVPWGGTNNKLNLLLRHLMCFPANRRPLLLSGNRPIPPLR